MKQLFGLLFVAGLVIIAFFIFTYSRKDKDFSKSYSPSITSSPTEKFLDIAALSYGYVIDVRYNNQPLLIYAVKVQEESRIWLFPNFEESISAARLASQKGCSIAVNGGFYKEGGKPLGLFISQGELLGDEVESVFLNGYFWQEKDGEIGISWAKPRDWDKTDFIMQSGPFIDLSTTKLKIVDDERERRSLLGMDQDGNIYLIAITDAANRYSGPYLADLPEIFAQRKLKNNLALKTLLNLDGGSASFFYVREADEEFILPELVFVGSVICVRS